MRSNDDYFASLPRKRMAAAALLLDAEQRMLIVKPTYRTHWLLPGGVIEENESTLYLEDGAEPELTSAR